MKSKLLGVLIVMNLLIVSLLGIVMISVPGDGENGSNDIYVLPMTVFAPIAINDVNQLQNMSFNLAGDYHIDKDIDCSAAKMWNSGDGFNPVADGKGYFNGTFDGKGHKLLNLQIDRGFENYVGLFGYVGKNAKITNLTLENVIVHGGNYTGALAGVSMGTIDNCDVTSGFVTSWRYVGGLIGKNDGGPVSNSSTQCRVTAGTYNIGGLIGINYYGNVTDCYTTGDTEGDGGQHGGLMGNSEYGIIKNCYATGKVTGSATSDEVGGLIGDSDYDKILDCYATGDVSAYNYIGGLLGLPEHGTFINCYATGTVTGTGEDIGGFAGEVFDTDIINCYATGDVNGDVYVGGLVGDSSSVNINNSYSTGEVTATDSYAGGLVGYFVGGEINDCWHTGDLDLATDYAGGIAGYLLESTINNSYAIVNITTVDGDYLGGLVGRAEDSDVFNSSAESTIDADSADSDGLGGLIGYIKNVKVHYCNAETSILNGYGTMGGLIGSTSTYADINFCYSTGSLKSTGDGGDFGGLIGGVYGNVNINNSYSSCSVDTVYDYNGGLVGYADTNTIIMNSFSTGKIIGDYATGGFIGFAIGTIENCFSTGDVTATGTYSGGFVGRLWIGSRINNSYCTGYVQGSTSKGGFAGDNNSGIMEGCYYDKDTVGTTTKVGTGSSTGITIHNTSMMKKEGTYKPASWDYVNTWGIIEDKTYPFLRAFYKPPVVLTKSLAFASEDSYYTTKLEYQLADYPPDNVNTFSYKTNAGSWLAFDDVDTISGFPQNAHVGNYWIEIEISDLVGSTVSENLTLKVINTNDDPDITTADNGVALEDELYSVDYEATDIDPTSDSFTWNLTPTVSWLSFNTATGLMTGTPSNADVGGVLVTLKVEDGKGGSDKHEFTLTVVNVNDPPVINTTDVSTVMVDEVYSVDYEANDIDPTDDVLHWSLLTQADWLSIDNSTGELTGTPTSADIGTWKVTVMVSDGNGGIDLTTFDIEVLFANHAPEIVDDALLKTTNEDVLYYFDFEVIDVDLPSDSHTWSMDTDATWLNLEVSTGFLSGTPGNAEVGSYMVEISVVDEHDGNDTINYTLTVVNVNDPPTITTTDVLTATEDSLYNVDYDAVDIDPGPDTLTWKLDGAPPWLSIDAATGNLTGTPTNDDVGKASVTVKIEDGNGGSDTAVFVLTVENTNDAPVWMATPDDLNFTAGLKLVLSALAKDVDIGDSITYAITSLPSSEIAIDKNTGIITWAVAKTGTYDINATATDGEETIHHSFALTVAKSGVVIPPGGNNPPTVEPVATDQSAKVGDAFELTITGTDSDEGSELTYELEDEPEGMIINNDGEILWVPEPGQEGEHTVTAIVSDGINETEVSFSVNVAKSDEPGTDGDGESEATGLESPAISIPLGLIIGIIIGIIIGLMMRARKKPEAEAEAETEEPDSEDAEDAEDSEDEEAMEEEAEEAEEELDEEEDEAEWEE